MSQENHRKLNIFIKRAYEDATPEDGYRVLIDRIWPRGRNKATLKLDQWARDVAPSADLRKWFGHDPKRWEAFQKKYQSELQTDEKREQMRCLLAEAGDQSITLIYGAKDKEHNQAIVLQDVLLNLNKG